MKEGLVSVVMPTYNAADYIAQSIESIRSQTYQDWELLIVDDCSDDQTSDIVERFLNLDDRIFYTCLEENSGAAVARNAAIEMAQGEYIAFCDSDDLWLPLKLDKQLQFMKSNKLAFTCTSYEWIDEGGNNLDRIIQAVHRVDYNRMLLDCPVGNSSVMYSVKRIGKFFVPDIRKRNDDALWLKMLKVEPYIYGLQEVLMKYRVRSGSLSSNKLDVVKYHWRLYREIEHLSVPRSAFHIAYWGFLKIFKLK